MEKSNISAMMSNILFFYNQGVNSKTQEVYKYLDIGTIVGDKESSTYAVLRCNMDNVSDEELNELISFFEEVKRLRKKL